MFKKRKLSTRKLLNLKNLVGDTLIGYNNHKLLFYAITPFNLSVLSNENIEAKIFALMNSIKSNTHTEIITINDRENFRFNKEYLNKRIIAEENEKVKELLIEDLEFIDSIQSDSVTSKTFLFVIRIKNESENDLNSLKLIHKTFNQFGFSIKQLNNEEIKRLLAYYYENNTISEVFEDINGERWYLNEKMKSI